MIGAKDAHSIDKGLTMVLREGRARTRHRMVLNLAAYLTRRHSGSQSKQEEQKRQIKALRQQVKQLTSRAALSKL